MQSLRSSIHKQHTPFLGYVSTIRATAVPNVDGMSLASGLSRGSARSNLRSVAARRKGTVTFKRLSTIMNPFQVTEEESKESTSMIEERSEITNETGTVRRLEDSDDD